MKKEEYKIIYSDTYLKNFIKLRWLAYNINIFICFVFMVLSALCVVGTVIFYNSPNKFELLMTFVMATIIGWYACKFNFMARDKDDHMPLFFIVPFCFIVPFTIGTLILRASDSWNRIKIEQAKEIGVF